MNLVERAKNIIVTPKTEWQVIAGEATPAAQLVTGYVLPLAAIAAIAGFIGLSLIGGLFGMRLGITWGLVSAIYHLVMAVVMVYVMAFIIDALAPSFGAQKNFAQALKVAAYSYTPVWVMGIVNIIPLLGILVLLAAIYAVYLLYLGLQGVMRAPPEKAAGYTAVAVIAGIVIAVIVNVIGGILVATGTPGLGMGGMGGMGRHGAGVTFDRDSRLGKLEEFGRKMDEASKRMDEAQKSGDPNKQMEAALGALGTALSGGKGVDPVQLDQLKPFVPEKFVGLARKDASADRSGVKGLMMAKAGATYADDEGKRRVELEVTDTGGAAGLMGLAAWMGVQGEHEDSHRREVTRTEGDRMVHEEVYKQGGRSEYTVVLGQRFIVSATGHGVDLDTLRSGVNDLELGKLASLK
ncbi:MAG TPA: Yip1 family protein [Usitatibacter sp.]|nr:Yip1 family protein [Usitatibacter sp.]